MVVCAYIVNLANTFLKDVRAPLPLPFCVILVCIPVALMENEDTKSKGTDDSTPQRHRKVSISLIV